VNERREEKKELPNDNCGNKSLFSIKKERRIEERERINESSHIIDQLRMNKPSQKFYLLVVHSCATMEN
jgi:hypothetical protein